MKPINLIKTIKTLLFSFILSLVTIPNISFAAPTDCFQTSADGTAMCIAPNDWWTGVFSQKTKTFEQLTSLYEVIGCSGYTPPGFYTCVNRTFTGYWDGFAPPYAPQDTWITKLNPDNKTGVIYQAHHPISIDYGIRYFLSGGTATHIFACPTGYTRTDFPDNTVLCKPNYVNNQLDSGCPTGNCSKTAQGVVTVADPVDAGSGNKYDIFTDYAYNSNNPLPLSFTRIYNSKMNSWSNNYSRGVTYNQSSLGKFIVLNRPNGDSFGFKNNASTSNNWVAINLNTSVTLVSVSNSQIVVKNDTGEIETYNNIVSSTNINEFVYQLVSISKSNDTLLLNYNSEGDLSTVTDSFGRFLTISFVNPNNCKFVSTVTAPGNLIYTYTYDNSCTFTKVTYPDNSTNQYTYSNNGGIATIKNGLLQVTQNNGYAYSANRNGYTTSYNSIGSAATVNRINLSYNTNTTVLTDARGNTVTMNVTKNNDITKTTGFNSFCSFCTGLQGSNIQYNTNGFVSQITDYKNNVSTFTWDTNINSSTNNLLLSMTQAKTTAIEKTTTYTWDGTWRKPATVTEPINVNGTITGNRVTSYTYDSNGNVLTKSITVPNLNGVGTQTKLWQFTYNSLSLLTELKSPKFNDNGEKYTFEYSDGRLSKVTNALSQSIIYSNYNNYGNPQTIDYPNGTRTLVEYNTLGNITKITKQNSSYTQSIESQIVYNAAQMVEKIIAPEGHYKKMIYDTAQRVSSIEEYDSNNVLLGKTVYTLDNMSNPTKIQIFDASNVEIRLKTAQYDSKNRLWKDIGSLNQTSTITYDLNSNVQQITDANNKNTIFSYDALDRLTSQTNMDNGVINYSYNPDDSLASVQDPKGLTTNYLYNGFGELVSLVSPDTGTTSIVRDLNGNITQKTDAKNQVTNYTYDVLNRVTNVNYSDTTKNISLTYDCNTTVNLNAVGKLCTVTDSTGSTNYTYDDFGRISSKVQVITSSPTNITKTIGVQYNTYGRISKIIYPSSLEANYSYINGKQSSLNINGNNFITNTTYESFNPRLSSYTLSNGVVYNRTFNKDGLISGFNTSLNVLPINKSITYDTRFNITNLTDSDVSKSSVGTYDNMSRLLTYNYGNISNPDKKNSTYNYNTTGDRLSKTTNSVLENYVYDSSSHKLTNDGVDSYTYDNNGSTLTQGSNKTYTYDITGRMTGFTDGTNTAVYKLNYQGLRVVKSVSNGSTTNTTNFIYTDDGVIIGDYDFSGNTKSEYIYFNGLLVALNQAGNIYNVFNDSLDTPRLITDSSNVVQWQWENIDSFGNNNPIKVNPSIDFNLRFNGQYFDIESGLSYNNQRDFNSNTGRFMQSDPIGLNGGINTYGYVEANPLGMDDPLGLWGKEAHEKIIDAAFGNTLSPDLIDLIKEGSADTDALQFQIPGTGRDYTHAMRSSGQSVEEAKSKYCKYVNGYMQLYRKRLAVGSPLAYRSLGRALHAIMDSTSPMHRGFQEWVPDRDWTYHGNSHGSLEGIDSLTPKLLKETVDLINQSMSENSNCPCGNF